jgi:AbrB family looped-hinge helix DNA binding protein
MEHVVSIDPAGRVVIPKAVRDALQLRGGTRLRLLQKHRTLVLEPIQEESVLLVRDGMTLIGGELEGPPRDYHAISREARLGELVKRVTPQK